MSRKLCLQVWVHYFAGIVAFQYHPRNEPQKRMSLHDCAKIADTMMDITSERFPENEAWDTWPRR